jgi:alcohol dehydrogenase YqhD (iron-dependent ADH family)
MIDFDFRMPTRIIFGHQSEAKVGEILSGYGFKKVSHCLWGRLDCS